MTQQQETTNPVAIEPPQSEPTQQAPAQGGKPALAIASIALLLTLGLSGGLYWYGDQTVGQIASDQKNQIEALKTQLQQQQQQMQQQQQQMLQQLSQQSSSLEEQTASLKSEQSNILHEIKAEQKVQLTQINQKMGTTEEHYQNIEQKLEELDVGDLNQWRLFEAQYLIHLSGRKLWLEQDLGAAKSLLDSADQSIAYLKDPSLLPLRRAIVDDINAIDAVDDIDTDGIVLKLGSLIDQIDTLSMAELELPQELQPINTELDDNFANWRTNLYKSWLKFSENFVTVRRRDGTVEALIEPRHTWYLQQNLKLALQQAQVAATSQKTEQYIACLQRANNWIGQYFENNASAKHLQSNLADLEKQTIITPLPQTLTSLSLIDQTIIDQQKHRPEEEL